MASNISAGTNSASAPAWRQFSFFDPIPVKDIHDANKTPEIFKATLEISTITSSSAGILVADIYGSIHLLDKDFESISSWVAHVGGRVTHMVEKKGILVTLGEENTAQSPLIKIWDLGKKDRRTTAPLLLRSAKVQPSNRPHPVSTVALSANLSHLAIGLGDGTVLLYRHLDQSLASSGSLTTLPKPRTIHESPTEPITGLGFREPILRSLSHAPDAALRHSREPTDQTDSNLYLFIVTTNHVLVHQATGRGAGSSSVMVVDEIGAGLGCAVMSESNMIVARDEAIYMCAIEGRGNAFAYEGNKSAIHVHSSYLVIISPPFVASASAASATVRNFVRTTGDDTSEISKVTVFDHANKFVAYSGTFSQGVREIFSAPWGDLYILGNNGELTHLIEKSTSAKLDMLYKRSLYGLALNLAKTQNLDDSHVADIHRQYGDHLYSSKNDYDGAMTQYVKTLGWVQPSYVIRKFLDAQRIHNLVTYLQELHTQGCVETGQLHQNGIKYERHEDYLRIQIEDAGKYSEALLYLRKLGMDAAEGNLARYGRALLSNLPQETTELLIDLCTTTLDTTVEVIDNTGEETPISAVSKSTAGGASYLSYLTLHRNSIAGQASETATVAAPSVKTVRVGDIDGSTIRRSGSLNSDGASGTPRGISPPPTALSTIGIAPMSARPPNVNLSKRLSPRLYFAHFVDHMEQFVVFLETVALRRWGQSVDENSQKDMSDPSRLSTTPDIDDEEDRHDQVAVWNTLLELYLTLPGLSSSLGSSAPQDEIALKEKALRVLRSETIPYDTTHALILCSSRGYTKGLVLLWEKMGMYEDVLRFWMERDKEGATPEASTQVLKHLQLYGPKHPHLYTLVLRFLTSSPVLFSRHMDDVKEVIQHIDQENIMPPLGIIQVLSRNDVASVGLVKEWLIERITQERGEIQADREWVSSYRMETAAKLNQVQELSDPEHPKVFHVTRCSTCGGQLDLPSIHFMCNHSYHQRCLPDNETECPNCAREHGVIREIRRNNEQLADQHDLFVSEVQEGGFKALANAFSRGLFNQSRLDSVAV
ncbi:vacuolar membrane protein [Lentinula edodes]|uniref:E3 ubiquitin-protein ligase PEP5 n=1 Tax=Lentinula edodes TaxID=5353 RepID=A0A1Q3ENR8_LENED|nr:vacuolar membrane protein [Lentinula edodes]